MLLRAPLPILLVATLVVSRKTDVLTVSVFCTRPEASACRAEYGSSDENASATAVYDLSTNLTAGFATLTVSTHEAALDTADAQISAAFAAGYAEATLTAEEMAQFFENVYEFGPEGPSSDLVAFVEDNDAYVRGKAADLSATSDYWNAVSALLAQFDGIVAGYAARAEMSNGSLPARTSLDWLWVNLDGDLFDLQSAVGSDDGISVGRMGRSSRQFEDRTTPNYDGSTHVTPNGLRCSSLFKLTDDNDLFFGHDTWDTYATAAPRIWKYMTLPTRQKGSAEMRTISFSSSPGFISSIDDYYVIKGAGGGGAAAGETTTTGAPGGGPSKATSLVVIETSLSIYNSTAYEAVTQESVLYYLRVMAASYLASTPADFQEIYSIEASGTYNNQWQVLDLNGYNKNGAAEGEGRVLADGSFVVFEEVPGLIYGKDMSQFLEEQRYWPSFNVVYFNETRAISGETASYTDAVRARLFREMQGNVSDDASMKWMMAWNDYANDPITSSPRGAIMARYDLSPNNPLAWVGGGIDSKYSSAAHVTSTGASFARAGPTRDDQPPFCWTAEFAETPHVGHPDCFVFDWGQF